MARAKVAGSLYLMLIGMAVCLVGTLFSWMMWRSYSRASAMDSWAKVSALVQKSEIVSRQGSEALREEFQLQQEYSFHFKGGDYSSDRFSLRGARWSHDRKKVEAQQERYPVGSTITAYVNPSSPEVSVLKKDTKAPLYSIWFPGIFVLGGGGIFLSGVRSLKR